MQIMLTNKTSEVPQIEEGDVFVDRHDTIYVLLETDKNNYALNVLGGRGRLAVYPNLTSAKDGIRHSILKSDLIHYQSSRYRLDVTVVKKA